LTFEAITNIPDSYKIVKGQPLEINLKLLNDSKLTWPKELEMTAYFVNGKYIEKLQQEVEHNQIADIKFTCGPWDTEGKSKAHLQFNWVCEKTKTKYFSKKIHISVNVVSNEDYGQDNESRKSRLYISEDDYFGNFNKSEYRSSEKPIISPKQYKEDIILQQKDLKNSNFNKPPELLGQNKGIEKDDSDERVQKERLLSKSSVVN